MLQLVKWLLVNSSGCSCISLLKLEQVICRGVNNSTSQWREPYELINSYIKPNVGNESSILTHVNGQNVTTTPYFACSRVELLRAELLTRFGFASSSELYTKATVHGIPARARGARHETTLRTIFLVFLLWLLLVVVLEEC